jgi:hypothetical protein
VLLLVLSTVLSSLAAKDLTFLGKMSGFDREDSKRKCREYQAIPIPNNYKRIISIWDFCPSFLSKIPTVAMYASALAS